MKLRVQREDGRIETIEIAGQWIAAEGEVLNRLSGDFVDHFFTPDGHYDGWGGSVHLTDDERAGGIISVMEHRRVID